MVAGSLAPATGGGAPARSLYRSLLRTARRMPDDHRTAFVVHRVRSEFEKSRKVADQAAVAARLHEGEVYRDQLELQAAHLSALAKQALLIPVDLRAPVVASSSSSAPSTSSAAGTASSTRSSTATAAITTPSTRKGPSRPPRHRPVATLSDSNSSPAAETETAPPPPPSSDPQPSSSSPHPLDRRKLLRAFSARDSQSEVKAARTNRFMQGPEPSWVLRRRRRQQEQEQVQGGKREEQGKSRDGGDHGGGCCGGHHAVETTAT